MRCSGLVHWRGDITKPWLDAGKAGVWTEFWHDKAQSKGQEQDGASTVIQPDSQTSDESGAEDDGVAFRARGHKGRSEDEDCWG